jgi:spore coat polysaccharide biosynthesis predicted glycosyltransferase SpsG
MTKLPLVEIFCEGNEFVGYGHIRRSITLANRLKKDGVDVRLIGISESARLMLPLSKPINNKACVAIFDSHFGIDNHLLEAKKKGQITITLDWFGKTIPDVNIAVYPHEEVRATQIAYVGFEYILVRDEIALLPRSKTSAMNENVLIVLGGADVLGQGHLVARYLSDKGLNVTLVQGALAKAKQMELGFNVRINPPELPELLKSCDWAVTNGGGCLFEALALGKAAYILPQTDAEMKIASFVLGKGAALGIGFDGLRQFDSNEINQVQKNGETLIDGRGAHRISAIIKGLL